MKNAFGALVIVIAGWVAWPYYAAWSLAHAIKQGDVVAIESKVDWEPLRASLRDQARSFMMAKIAADKSANGPNALAAGLAAVIGPKMIDGLVDSIVTPQGIAGLVKGQSPAEVAKSVATPKSYEGFRYDLVRWAFFSDPTTFRVDIASADGARQPDGSPLITTAVFNWSGSWKLSKIFLPLPQ